MEKQNLPNKTISIVGNAKNRKLIENLEKQGNKIVLFPEPVIHSIKIELSVLEELYDFDWLIFTDLHAVDFFLQTLEENNFNFFELDRLRICALGEAVSDRLRFSQIHSDVIPSNNKAKTVFSALSDYIFDENEFTKMKFMIVKEAKTPFHISDLLIEKQAFVTELSVYQSDFPPSAQITKLKAMIMGGGIDEFIFTSPDDVYSVSQIFGNESFGKLLSGIKITTSDAVTLQSFNEHK